MEQSENDFSAVSGNGAPMCPVGMTEVKTPVTHLCWTKHLISENVPDQVSLESDGSNRAQNVSFSTAKSFSTQRLDITIQSWWPPLS